MRHHTRYNVCFKSFSGPISAGPKRPRRFDHHLAIEVAGQPYPISNELPKLIR